MDTPPPPLKYNKWTLQNKTSNVVANPNRFSWPGLGNCTGSCASRSRAHDRRHEDKAHSLAEGSLLQTGGNINYSSIAEVNLLKTVDEFSAWLITLICTGTQWQHRCLGSDARHCSKGDIFPVASASFGSGCAGGMQDWKRSRASKPSITMTPNPTLKSNAYS